MPSPPSTPTVRNFLKKWLTTPEALPDEFKSWLLNFVATNPNFELDVQSLPPSIPFGSIAQHFGTTPPSSPQNGDIWIYQSGSNGELWVFRYNQASSSAYKWEFLGGAPLFAETTNDNSSTSTTYTALANAGPVLTPPRDGDYYVEIGAGIYNATTSGGVVLMSYDIGATGAVDADSIRMTPDTVASIPITNPSRPRRKNALTGGDALTAKYRVSAGLTTGHWFDRWMRLSPIRIS